MAKNTVRRAFVESRRKYMKACLLEYNEDHTRNEELISFEANMLLYLFSIFKAKSIFNKSY